MKKQDNTPKKMNGFEVCTLKSGPVITHKINGEKYANGKHYKIEHPAREVYKKFYGAK